MAERSVVTHLNLGDIQNIRALTRKENLKECSVAYAMCTTYFPVLLEMAEELVKTRALTLYKGDKIGYVMASNSSGFTIIGTDGSSFEIGPDREKCLDLLRRLNK